MPIISFEGKHPEIGKNVFIAPTAWVIGDVVLGDNVSIFFGATLRGDINPIRVGARTNIQENALLHTSHGLGDCIVGDAVTIGHSAIIHGCTVGDRCIIGMHSTLLDDAQIGSDCIIGANALVTMNTEIMPGSLALGSPAKVIRKVTEAERSGLLESAESYMETGGKYLELFKSGQE